MIMQKLEPSPDHGPDQALSASDGSPRSILDPNLDRTDRPELVPVRGNKNLTDGNLDRLLLLVLLVTHQVRAQLSVNDCAVYPSYGPSTRK